MRIIFMGTAELSCSSLEALSRADGMELVAVVTQPDRPKGRDLNIQPSPVKLLALNKNLSVLQPERARNPEFLASVRELKPDLIAVAAYGQILPQELLELPRFGCINVHTSLLPKYRGAAPIQWVLLRDDRETGVTIMKMDAGLDTGAILAQQRTPILPEDDARILHDRLAHMGAELLVRTIPDYVTGKVDPKPQAQEQASYAPKIKKQDGLIDWTRPARAIWCQVRGLVPWPGAFTFMRSGEHRQLLKIWLAEPAQDSGPAGEILDAGKNGIVVGCGEGVLRLKEVQREGGRRLKVEQFLAGHTLRTGDNFG